METNPKQSPPPEVERQKYQTPHAGIVYGFAAVVLFIALTVSLQLGLGIGLAALLLLGAWWGVLIVFWSHPVFCRFEMEHEWLAKTRQLPAGVERTLLTGLWVTFYWPLLLSKNVYFWALLAGVGIYYALKLR